MACAIPVIATAWGGPADYIDPSCGILLEVTGATSSDASTTIAQEFASAMRKLIADPVLRVQLGVSGRKRVEEFFDWDQKIGQILTIYRKAIHEDHS
jgi:glycosyltransferase involved in cell wall biosynthesis